MRLFTAIDLPENVKEYVFELEGEFKKNKAAKIKWVFKKNLHLTLKFFGEIPDKDVNELINKLENIRFLNFELELNSIGFYGGSKAINVIFVSVEPEDKIANLQKLVDAETIGLGDLKIGSHITLGRVKFVKNKKEFYDFAEKIKDFKIEKLHFEVDEFCLFKSVLRKEGPEYILLKRYKSAQ